MKVIFLDLPIYHQSGIYKSLTSPERKFYSFLKTHDDIKPDTWYECSLAGFTFDRNLEHIVYMDIDIKSVPDSTYAWKIRIDMADISDKFVRFDDFYSLCDDSLVVKIANLQNGASKAERENSYGNCI